MRWGAHPSSMRRGLAALALSSRSLPSQPCGEGALGDPEGCRWGDPRGCRWGDRRGHSQGDPRRHSQGMGQSQGNPGGPSQQPQPPCTGTRAFPVLSDKGPEPALCQHFQSCFPRRNQTLKQEHAWLSAPPTPGPPLWPLPGQREGTVRSPAITQGMSKRGCTARGFVWGGAAGLGGMGEGRGARGGCKHWIQPSRFDPTVLRG